MARRGRWTPERLLKLGIGNLLREMKQQLAGVCYRIESILSQGYRKNWEQPVTTMRHPTISDWSPVTSSGRIVYSTYQTKSYMWKMA